MKCRVCGKEVNDQEMLLNIKDDANVYYIHPMRKKRVSVGFYYCKECRLGQIKYCLPDDYYMNYNGVEKDNFKTVGRSNVSYYKGYYDGMLCELAAYNEHSKFLDIGCGRGDLLEIAQNYYESVEGVEPSATQAEIAKSHGFSVRESFFDRNWEGEGYDGISLTQVLEHLDNPVEIIRKSYEILSNGGGIVH